MSESQFEEWVEKAEEDYRAATALEASDVPAVVCFHCQQCIEKYLKAALVVHRAQPPRAHDLIALNETLEKIDGSFAALAERLHILTPYSVFVRYPGGKASVEDAQGARQAMQELRAEIRRLLDLEGGA